MASLRIGLCKTLKSSKLLGLGHLSKFQKLVSPATSTFCRWSSTSPKHHADPALYDQAFKRSIENPEEFWAEQAEGIVWHKKWNRVLDDSIPYAPKWFSGGELNVCYNAVDRHVEAGMGEQAAILQDSPVTGVKRTITYNELLQQVSKFAGVLSKHGVVKGDRVLIYMPMIPEAIITQLACARLGALHSLVFGGFAPKQLAPRINHAQPKVIVSANCGMEPNKVVNYKPMLDEAINLSDHKPQKVVIYNRDNHEAFEDSTMISGRDVCFREEMATAKPHDPVPVEAMEPLYLLYTSGTTGTPKAIVRPAGGHAVVLNWSMYNLYGIKPKEVWFAASDLGWVVGHSYITYAPLLHGNTTILYEGKPATTPDPGAYFRILEEYNVAGMFVAPTALRAIRREDEAGEFASKYSCPNFRSLFVAGEYCDHETMEWCQQIFKSPVLDNWWQTETGSAITATCVGLGNHLYPPPGVAGRPVPGWNVQVLSNEMKEVADYELGNIVVKLPLPPGSMSTLYKDHDRFKNLYFSNFKGYYDTMDAGIRDKYGNIGVQSRSDDVINVSGVRLSTGQLEEAVLEHEDIAEAAVVPEPHKLKGHVPFGFLVLKHDVTREHKEIVKEVVEVVRRHVGPVASFKKAVIVHKLPKTRSGKVARKTIHDMLVRKPYVMPVTIEDPTVYGNLMDVLREAGYDPLPPSKSKLLVY